MKLHGKTTTRGTNMTTMQTKSAPLISTRRFSQPRRVTNQSRRQDSPPLFYGVSIPESAVFERKYGILVTPGTQVTKKYVHMTPEEQAKFRARHRVTV